jgi:hypothetical protein
LRQIVGAGGSKQSLRCIAIDENQLLHHAHFSSYKLDLKETSPIV